MIASRRIAIFFYGLFMDPEILRGKGVTSTNARSASVVGFSLRIGKRATLVPSANGRVFGMLMQLTNDEIVRLYSDPSVSSYRPEAVSAQPVDGPPVPALCFNLEVEPSPTESNVEYAKKLRDLARQLNFPSWYVNSIQ